MKLNCLSCLGVVVLTALAGTARGVSIPVPNGDFESYDVPGVLDPTAGGDWSSEPGLPITDQLEVDDQFWSNGSDQEKWGAGWSTDNTTGGGWGLNHPDWGQFHHGNVDYSSGVGARTDTGDPNQLDQLFSGYFIGHMNLSDGQGSPSGSQNAIKYTQSGVLTQVSAGTYTAQVAVAFKYNQDWNDLEYTLSLVAAPDSVQAGFGSLGGTVIDSTSVTLQKSFGSDITTNEQWLQLVVNVDGQNPYLGQDLAIRITGENLGAKDGVATDTNTFTQATFDNVSLDYVVPEPTSLILMLITLVGGLTSRQRLAL